MQLELIDIHKSYGGQSALNGVNATLREFHALALVGPSGGGKSTLLRIIAGLEVPDCGTVYINGDPLPSGEDGLRRHRCSIGTVFQSFNLFPHLTALENIVLPLERVHGYGRTEAESYADQLLQRFQLQSHGHKRPAQLSGGQQQRVAIARAVAIKPRFLLFDEPTSALDPEMTSEVLDFIAELRSEGRDLIIVTHNMGFARQMADQCLFLANGQVVESGPATDIFEKPRELLVQKFFAKVLRY
ncbi:MAG: ATP-binding cassette domain-containing protein [Geobacter sp.]|nr:ATP-binding cassette domain-containing protein [Geobacter sp.]